MAVAPEGLVQRVALPAGTWTVSFSYRPSDAVAGIVVSAVVGVALLGWLAVDLVLWTRRRRADTPGRGGSADGRAATGDGGPDGQPGGQSPMASAARP
ncbi:MAG: hypothetical protein JO368_00800 [Acidimicrobiales bacterium]|nr:hypothetical protein [Acidimicrobiales bacterium]